MTETVNVRIYGTEDLKSLQEQIAEELSKRSSLPVKTNVKLYSHVPEEDYILGGYGRGLAALREACRNDPNSKQPLFEGQPRPLTPRESLLARIEDYERLRNPDGSERSMQDRLRLFNKGFWTSAGMLWEYPGNKSVPAEQREALVPVRAKIQEICPELLRLGQEVINRSYLDADFDSFEGELLDLTQGIWNTYLTEAQVPEHTGWRKLVGDDEEGGRILSNYAKIVFSEVQRQYRESSAMAFYRRSDVQTNEVRAPWVGSLTGRSVAYGDYSLTYSGAFLRGSIPCAD